MAVKQFAYKQECRNRPQTWSGPVYQIPGFVFEMLFLTICHDPLFFRLFSARLYIFRNKLYKDSWRNPCEGTGEDRGGNPPVHDELDTCRVQLFTG